MFDEIDASSAEALVTINSALAQNYMIFGGKRYPKHPNFYAVCAGNTFGRGANRQYCGRNSLDAATLDRFMVLEWDYDTQLEEKLIDDKDLLEFAWAVRQIVDENRMDIIISTRGIMATNKVLKANKEKNVLSQEEILWGNLFENVKVDVLNKIIGGLRKDKKNFEKIEKNPYYRTLENLANEKRK